jgi:hypothetical protein
MKRKLKTLKGQGDGLALDGGRVLVAHRFACITDGLLKPLR